MKYPVREERFDFATGKVGMVDVDIVEDMKQDIVSMLAMVTPPPKGRSIFRILRIVPSAMNTALSVSFRVIFPFISFFLLRKMFSVPGKKQTRMPSHAGSGSFQLPLPYGRMTYIRFQGSDFRPLSLSAPPASSFLRNAVIISLPERMSTQYCISLVFPLTVPRCRTIIAVR